MFFDNFKSEMLPITLSKVFYVDPKTLPKPKPVSPPSFPIFTDLRNSMLRNGFDSNRPIIVRMNEEGKEKEYKRIWKKNDRDPCIMDGNHRLAIALELKLEKIPVRLVLN